MNFPNPLVNPGIFASAEAIQNGGTNDFYLTTWNNAALIQTGHSSGASTLDEKKVIANTLWYLAQLTADTTAKVCSAFDLAAPDTPTVNHLASNQIGILSKDNGSAHHFYIKAINTTNFADTCTSNILEVINKSGLMGFYILEDEDPAGVPELSNPATVFIAAADNQQVTYTIQDLSKSIHIQAVDSAGNLSEVAHFLLEELDFDTYCATLWNNTFLLNLKKLKEDGYNVSGCRWFKDETELTVLNTINEFSYSAGCNGELLDTLPYTFQINTERLGLKYSTKKIITYTSSDAKKRLLIYPNPVLAGAPFTIEGINTNIPIRIYNYWGACISSTIAASSVEKFMLNVPGIYFIRVNNKSVKIVVVE